MRQLRQVSMGNNPLMNWAKRAGREKEKMIKKNGITVVSRQNVMRKFFNFQDLTPEGIV